MKCRSCGGGSFGEVTNLGLMPLVNNLLKRPDDPCPRWPLKVVFCRECSLAQLTETPPPQAMFSEYLYFSSQSHTMIAHAGDLVRRFVKPGQRVVEIASNDGYLLKQAKEMGARVLGVDPARNIAEIANKSGIPTRCEFFNRETAEFIVHEWGKADVIFANNVLAHVPDPNEIAAGINTLLNEDGVAHIEVPSLLRLIESCAFDTIYHEHHCYFSLCALKALFNRHDLRVIGVEVVPIHGGSFHLRMARRGTEDQAEQFCDQEKRAGVFADDFYVAFATRTALLKGDLHRVLNDFETVAAYGAAAKGVVLLNTFGLGVQRIPWVADVSPHKQGRFIPGTRQPIVSPEELLKQKPAAVLLLPWNIQDEVARRNRAYLDQGGRFIVPIPEVRIL